MPKDPIAKAFISHSSEERHIAVGLEQRLEAEGIESFAYENDIPFGATFPAEIRKHIEEADHFILLLSDASRHSSWVAREIGLALELQQTRKRRQPSILGVRCGPSCSSYDFPVRQFATNEGRPAYNFATRRHFDLTKSGPDDEFGQFVDRIRPAVTIVSSLEDISCPDLLQDSFECYCQLFPDEEERDLPTDIETWIAESRRAGSDRTPWREVYGILHMNDFVIGMAYLSAHVKSHWCFGNYFGVRAGYRQGGRAAHFYDHISTFLHDAIDPRMRGILFEVEEVDFPCLARAASLGTITGSPEKDEILRSLRRLKRLHLYQHVQHALAFLGPSRQPLPYRQPAMEETLAAEDEVPLILMTLLQPGVAAGDIDLQEVLGFIYDDLYGDAYGGAGSISIDGFRAYVDSMKRQVMAAASSSWSLGSISIARATRNLQSIAKKEGLEHELDL